MRRKATRRANKCTACIQPLAAPVESSLRRTHAWLGTARSSRTRRPGCLRCRRAAACRASGSSFLSAPTKTPAQRCWQPRTGCVSVRCSYRVHPTCGLVLAVELLGLRRGLFALDTLAAPAQPPQATLAHSSRQTWQNNPAEARVPACLPPRLPRGRLGLLRGKPTSDGLARLRRYAVRRAGAYLGS